MDASSRIAVGDVRDFVEWLTRLNSEFKNSILLIVVGKKNKRK